MNSFNIEAAEQFVKKLKRRLSEPNLKKLKKLTKRNVELLKKFDTAKLLNRISFYWNLATTVVIQHSNKLESDMHSPPLMHHLVAV